MVSLATPAVSGNPRRLLWVAMVLVLAAPPWCRAGDLPSEVRAGLEASELALTRIGVTWEERRSSPLSLPELQRATRNTDTSLLADRRVKFVRDGKKAYYSSGLVIKGKTATDVSEVAYDGVYLYCGSRSQDPSKGDPVLFVQKIDIFRQENGGWNVLTIDYLRQVGFVVPETVARLDEPTRSAVLSNLAEGYAVAAVREEQMDGLPCVAVDLRPPAGAAVPPPGDASKGSVPDRHARRLVLDPARSYAVLRSEERGSKGELAVVTDNSEFIRLADGNRGAVWLPKRCKVVAHAAPTAPGVYSKTPLLVTDYSVVDFQLSVPSTSLFALDHEYKRPGTAVSTAKIPGADKLPGGRVDFIVPANPEDLDDAVRAALEGKQFTPKSRFPVMRSVLTFVAIGLAVVVGILAYYRWRWRKTAGGV